MLKISFKNTIKKHKIILLCMVLLMVSAAFVCSLSVFQFNDIKQDTLMHGKDASVFVVHFNEAVDSNMYENIKSVISKYSYDLNKVYSVTNNTPSLHSYYFGDDYVNAGNPPQNDNEIVIGNVTAAKGCSIGDVLQIGEKSYTVCGIRAAREYDEVLPSGLEKGTKISEMQFKWGYSLPSYKVAQISKYMADMFEGKKIDVPEEVNVLDGMFFELRTAILIAGIAVCNLIFIFSYLMNQKKSLYSVFRICGAGSIRIATTAFIELLIYAIVGSAFGDLLYLLLLYEKQTASKAFLLEGLAISFGISVFLCVVISIPILAVTFFKDLLREEDTNV
ncbi:MAG: hypothetical protein RR552_05320 [Oscillospiraceae bacterium]